MARAARDHGYQYFALTDHSRSLTITNGLSLERLEEARRHVERLNHELAPFVVLLGTEMDILQDGQLDYPDDVLASLDYVSASVHSRFKQTEELMTPRILRAVSHPLVHTLNHPHGRLLGIRPRLRGRHAARDRDRRAARLRHGSQRRPGPHGPGRRLARAASAPRAGCARSAPTRTRRSSSTTSGSAWAAPVAAGWSRETCSTHVRWTSCGRCYAAPDRLLDDHAVEVRVPAVRARHRHARARARPAVLSACR